MHMLEWMGALAADESGASMAEYGIIAAAIVLPIIAVLALISSDCGTALTTTGNGLTAIGQTNP